MSQSADQARVRSKLWWTSSLRRSLPHGRLQRDRRARNESLFLQVSIDMKDITVHFHNFSSNLYSTRTLFHLFCYIRYCHRMYIETGLSKSFTSPTVSVSASRRAKRRSQCLRAHRGAREPVTIAYAPVAIAYAQQQLKRE